MTALLGTIVVDDDIVGNTRQPPEELTRVCISATLHFRDRFKECLLEQVIGQILIFHYIHDIAEDFFLTP